MQINIEGAPAEDENFFFEAVPNKALEEKETKEILTKWGLFETLKIGTFRYNQHFQQFEANRFLADLFNSPNVRYVIDNLNLPAEPIGNVQFERLRCHELTMDMFDLLEKEGIVKKGYIAKMMADFYEGIEICDKLRECLILEESESFCAFSDEQRKQFLFKLFQMLVVGGSFNQYEDMIQPYLDWTKKFYKSFVSVRKRPQTQQIYIESYFYSIQAIDKSFKKGYHPQNLLYVIINPSTRTVHILANQWKKFW